MAYTLTVTKSSASKSGISVIMPSFLSVLTSLPSSFINILKVRTSPRVVKAGSSVDFHVGNLPPLWTIEYGVATSFDDKKPLGTYFMKGSRDGTFTVKIPEDIKGRKFFYIRGYGKPQFAATTTKTLFI